MTKDCAPPRPASPTATRIALLLFGKEGPEEIFLNDATHSTKSTTPTKLPPPPTQIPLPPPFPKGDNSRSRRDTPCFRAGRLIHKYCPRQFPLDHSPPFTSIIAPLTKLAASEARNSAALATSSAVPARPRAIFCTASAFISWRLVPCGLGVSMMPGAMLLTRISGPQCCAI